MKYLAYFPRALLLILLLPPAALPQTATPVIRDFKVQALYRAAKLTWKAKEDLKSPLSVQILRADSFEDAPYKEVETINLTPGKSIYEYIDKSMGTEARYFYKLTIKETGESFGPIFTRPYFSPPAT